MLSWYSIHLWSTGSWELLQKEKEMAYSGQCGHSLMTLKLPMIWNSRPTAIHTRRTKLHAWIQHQSEHVSTSMMARQRSEGCNMQVTGQSQQQDSPLKKSTLVPNWEACMVDIQGETDAGVRARIGKVRTVFQILKKVWSFTEIGKSTKLRIFSTNVKPILLWGSEKWRMIKPTLHKLQTFINTCLPKIFCSRWPEKISNEDVWNQWLHRSMEENGAGLATP